MTEKAQEIQKRLDDLQQELHAAVEKSDKTFNEQRNQVFAERRTMVAELIKSKEIPENFWALALISLLQLKDEESVTMPHFLGPYDQELLNKYLIDLHVEYGAKGHKVTFVFKPNPFFKETELWAECFNVHPPTEEDGAPADQIPEADDDMIEESWMFSGVSWNEGYGPQLDEDDEEQEDDDDKAGSKRARNEEKSSVSTHQGPSMLEMFNFMLPHPSEDEEMDEEDEEDIAEAIEDWEEEMEDRKMLMRLIVNYVHTNPVEAITGKEEMDKAKKCGKGGECGHDHHKKSRTE